MQNLPNAQCTIANDQLSTLFNKVYVARLCSFFKRVEVYGLFSNGAIISYWGNAGESISSVLFAPNFMFFYKLI